MATVTGVTAQRANEIEAASVVGATIQGKNLVLETHGGTQINVGQIIPDLYTNYPVGSIYMSTNSANPSTYMGGGTWVRWGKGRVPVGIDEADGWFDGVEEQGGQKTYTMALSEMPPHDHGAFTGYESADHTHTGYTGGNGNHAHNYSVRGGAEARGTGNATASSYSLVNAVTDTQGWHDHSVQTYGATSTSHRHSITANGGGVGVVGNNLQPYITCYMWKRTA